MELRISMVREYLARGQLDLSPLEGTNSLFRSFRVELPEQPEEQMLYLQVKGDNVLFSCGQGAFVLFHSTLANAVTLTLNACQYYDHWEKSLLTAVWDRPDYQTLIDASAEIFQNPMLITNWQGKVLGYTRAYQKEPVREFWSQLVSTGVLPISCLQNLRESSHFGILEKENHVNLLHFEEFGYTCILGLVHEKHEIILHFQIIEYSRRITETDLLLAQTLLGVLQRIHRETQPAYHESATYIFSELLSGKSVEIQRLNWVLSAFGWNTPDLSFYLVGFQVTDQKGNAKSMLQQLERSIPGSKMLIHEELPVMLLSQPLFDRFKDDLLSVAQKWHLKCAVSFPFEDWNNLEIYYSQAISVLQITEDIGRLHFCQEHSLFFLMEDMKRSIARRHMMHPAVKFLAAYDAENRTELVKTLHCFLLNERNSTLSSEKLYIHRNTLQYRIHKILELTGVDLEDPIQRLHLLITCDLTMSNDPSNRKTPKES